VNIPGDDGEHLSRRFTSRSTDTFAGVPHRISTGGALVTIECDLVAARPGGDHTIFVGAVRAVSARGRGAAAVLPRPLPRAATLVVQASAIEDTSV
jgi:3-hydroxy-9,10-secoandrosta-1,3,5(10)-triene-9,17-dione monooxygenase reductase component